MTSGPEMTFPQFLLATALLLFAAATSAESVAQGGDISLLHDQPGHSGGQVTGGIYTLETSTGAAIGEGVSVYPSADIVAKGGYTGQLYDPAALTLAADPGTTVDEGDASQLSGRLALDDGTFIQLRNLTWNVLEGPASVTSSGLAVAGPVDENSVARISGTYLGLTDLIELSVVDLPYETYSLAWEDPAEGAHPPYRVIFGKNPSSLTLAGFYSTPTFNPGQLDLGTTYYYQVFDALGNDITPGGPGVMSFRTKLYRPDLRIGKMAAVRTHLGNGIYNRTGKRQTLSLQMAPAGRTAVFFSVQNDGDAPDSIIVRGSRARASMKYLRYFKLSFGRQNITAATIRTGGRSAKISPRQTFAYVLRAKPTRSRKKSGQKVTIRARSSADGRACDVAKAKLEKAGPKR
ncbi:MAG: hypothetical protein KDN18_07980 [Verrucomicrobiae bacterium]|nr:hypothetical protein [Verrucomicrobiae bacterium]